MTKTAIAERLGENAVLLPEQLAAALGANDRAKLRLTLLQDAAAHAAGARAPQDLSAELRAAGLDAAALGRFAAEARALDDRTFAAPGLDALLDGLAGDLRRMLAPLRAAGAPEAAALAERLEALTARPEARAKDTLELAAVGRMTAARRDGPDSLHLLVMDLHRAINRLAAETAVEDVAGAKTHDLTDADRARVAAFMRGLARTAPLAFGHPGLGTTAARAGERLVIQNDIGETDAHVLVVHVDALAVTVTYTDVHRRRAKFFMDLFGGRMSWSPLAERPAEGLGEDAVFHLVTGRGEAADAAALDGLLEFLGSRIVFLIDWNKARKALQLFVERDAAIGLLAWAAAKEVGHRGFLVMGGADLVLEIVRRIGAGRVPYGVRLDQALGAAQAQAFLRGVLQTCGEGLRAGRSTRLIRDEIQADLAEGFESAESAALTLLVRHLGLSRTLAGLLAAAIGSALPQAEAGALAGRAKRMEAKADRLTLEVRDLCGHLERPQSVRRLMDAAEDAMDSLDECAFLVSQAAWLDAADRAPLERLAQIAVTGCGQLVRAAEAAVRLPEGRREDAVAALQALDAVTAAERDGDDAERAAIAALAAAPAADARRLVLGLEIARALEGATDHLAHAALALRERVLEEIAA